MYTQINNYLDILSIGFGSNMVVGETILGEHSYSVFGNYNTIINDYYGYIDKLLSLYHGGNGEGEKLWEFLTGLYSFDYVKKEWNTMCTDSPIDSWRRFVVGIDFSVSTKYCYQCFDGMPIITKTYDDLVDYINKIQKMNICNESMTRFVKRADIPVFYIDNTLWDMPIEKINFSSFFVALNRSNNVPDVDWLFKESNGKFTIVSNLDFNVFQNQLEALKHENNGDTLGL